VERNLSIAFRTLKYPQSFALFENGAVKALLKTAREYPPHLKVNWINGISLLIKY
jgi:hypothetical protein